MMVELGNFQMKSSVQNRTEITWDTFTDIYSLTHRNRGTGTKRIFESFDWDNFNWSQSYIKSRFAMASTYKDYADYLVFLLMEEVYLPSQVQKIKGISAKTANGSAYTIPNSNITIPKMPDAGEEAYFLALLKAWHSLCKTLNKKTAILGCASPFEPNPAIGWKNLYSTNGLSTIAANYDMVYIYRFPTTGNATKSGYRAKDFINYWRNTLNYKGKINYLLDTYFNKDVGSLDYNTIKADFTDAANSGADIISAYPFKNVANKDTDFSATSRLIQIANEYQPTQCKQIVCNFTIN